MAWKGAGLKRVSVGTGLVFEFFNVFPHRTAFENVALAAVRIGKRGRGQAESTARGLLDARWVNVSSHCLSGQ
jgi:ABC-type polar amino acid transport system ATPase subunit